jgi:molybdopterin/thiamine biosynthesis adenylyltransferase
MNDRYSRQTFLGSDAPRLFRTAKVAIIGLGGGGSHVAQQLAYVGIGHIQLYDPDHVDHSNLNRLVGATLDDARLHELKVKVAQRIVLAANPQTHTEIFASKWEIAASELREADIVVSCVDTYGARQDIEATARRFLIPLVDIGMDVHLVDNQPQIAGQVILSVPDGPCMRCLGFLNDERLRQEADQYGAAGYRPQVVWTNGVLASVAVGIVVDLITGWRSFCSRGEYLHYDGNTHELSRSPRLEYAPDSCAHFPLNEIGEPRL